MWEVSVWRAWWVCICRVVYYDCTGTYTDSVLLCVNPDAASSNLGVLASFKHPTTPAVSDGIEAAVRAVLQRTKVAPDQVSGLMIGSEHRTRMHILELSDKITLSDAFYE